jgi:hypothetical protein
MQGLQVPEVRKAFSMRCGRPFVAVLDVCGALHVSMANILWVELLQSIKSLCDHLLDSWNLFGVLCCELACTDALMLSGCCLQLCTYDALYVATTPCHTASARCRCRKVWLTRNDHATLRSTVLCTACFPISAHLSAAPLPAGAATSEAHQNSYRRAW